MEIWMKNYILSYSFAIILVTILNLLISKCRDEYMKKVNWQHYLFGYFFILYLMISLVDVTGFPSLSEWKRMIEHGKPILNLTNINLIPFVDGVELPNVLNIIFFMPFGFLLPTLWDKFKKLTPTLLYGFIFSAVIEVGQLFTMYRGSNVDDLIMNTFGTLVGWLIFKKMSKVFNELASKTGININKEDIIFQKIEPCCYILIAIICTFLF